MPTEIIALLARKRKAQAQQHADTSIILMSLIAALIVVMLLFVNESFARAMAEVGGLYWPPP